MRTFGKISIVHNEHKDLIKIENCEPQVAIRLKSLFKKLKKENIIHYLDILEETCTDLNWFLLRYPFDVTEEARNILNFKEQQYKKRQQENEVFFTSDYKPKDFKLKIPLRKYQAQSVELFLKNKILLNGDEIGLGKTACCIASAMDSNTLPMAIVVQTHLPFQWGEQIKKFCNLSFHIIKKRTPYILPKADIYIFKYSCLSGWTDIFTQKFFKMVCFDECQELRRCDSDKYTSAKILARHCKYILSLSATPIYNKGREIFNILDLMKEDCLGSENDFLREWCLGNDEVRDPKALGAYLRESYLFLRRTREEVKMELPQINKIVYEVDYDTKEIEKVEEVAKQLAMKVLTGTFIERGQAAREFDMMLRHNTGVAKARSVAAYTKMFLESGESILLVGWHRDCYSIWLDELKDFKPVLYTGSESAIEKEESKRKFISKETQLMIMSLRSGIGLDGLQDVCSTVIFGELDWSPQVHQQVIGRLNRNGQQKQVTAIYLVTNEGSDPPIIDLLGLKASQSQGIIDPFKTVEENYNDTTKIKELAKKYLDSKGVEYSIDKDLYSSKEIQ